MSLIGFTGHRSLPQSYSAKIKVMVQWASSRGSAVGVGCAAGADLYVRQACTQAIVYRAQSRQPRHLVKRSCQLAQAVSAAGFAGYMLGFPHAPCPVALVPSPLPSRCFCGLGSGSWATLAYASGLGARVWVYGSPVPSHWPGKWSPFMGGQLYTPPPVPQQMGLFG